MKVSELIDKLSTLPQYLPVMIETDKEFLDIDELRCKRLIHLLEDCGDEIEETVVIKTE